jgi:hypothetical protein
MSLKKCLQSKTYSVEELHAILQELRNPRCECCLEYECEGYEGTYVGRDQQNNKICRRCVFNCQKK